MNNSHPIRILLVDDEEIIRYGISAILKCEAAIEVVGEAKDGHEALEMVELMRPDLVLMDINMPIMNGVVATEKICQAFPEIKVVILSTSTDNAHLNDAIQKGASGYLLKNMPPEDFIHVIQSAHKGYMQFNPLMGKKLHHQPVVVSQQHINDWNELTPREKDIAKLIAEGVNNRYISQSLHITEKTVKNHVSNILSRLEFNNRTQLAIWVNRLNIDVAH